MYVCVWELDRVSRQASTETRWEVWVWWRETADRETAVRSHLPVICSVWLCKKQNTLSTWMCSAVHSSSDNLHSKKRFSSDWLRKTSLCMYISFIHYRSLIQDWVQVLCHMAIFSSSTWGSQGTTSLASWEITSLQLVLGLLWNLLPVGNGQKTPSLTDCPGGIWIRWLNHLLMQSRSSSFWPLVPHTLSTKFPDCMVAERSQMHCMLKNNLQAYWENAFQFDIINCGLNKTSSFWQLTEIWEVSYKQRESIQPVCLKPKNLQRHSWL